MSARLATGSLADAPDARRHARRLVGYWRDIVCRHSEHYRATELPQLVASGLDPAEIVRRAPITHKEQLAAEPSAFALKAHGPDAPAEWGDADVEAYAGPGRDVRALLDAAAIVDPRERFLREWLPIHFQRSGGSTGRSVITAYTWTDVFGPFAQSAEMIYRLTGIGRSDLVLNLCPAAPHLGIYATIVLPLTIGQPNFSTFGGRVMGTEDQVVLAGQLRPRVLIGLTSYLGHWARTARGLVATGRVGPLDTIDTVICLGESVGVEYRARLGQLFAEAGAPDGLRVLEGMSSTELRGAGFYECDPRSGFHVDERRYHVELLDPVTHEAVAEREPGVVVWSHVDWRGHVLARYWSGDYLPNGGTRGRCPHCGRDGLRLLGPMTRWERDAVKFRGARIELLALREALSAVAGVDAFQVVLRRVDPDDPTSAERMDVFVGTDDDHGDLAERVARTVKQATEVRPDAVTVGETEAVDARVFARKLKGEYLLDVRGER